MDHRANKYKELLKVTKDPEFKQSLKNKIKTLEKNKTVLK